MPLRNSACRTSQFFAAATVLALSATVHADPATNGVASLSPGTLAEARRTLEALVPDLHVLSTTHKSRGSRVPFAMELPPPPVVCVEGPRPTGSASLISRRRCVSLAEFEREQRLARLRGQAMFGFDTGRLIVTVH
ncbi:MAG: hypothetical protein AAFX85_07590 [Pseudomonadota bacterium]